MLVVRAGLAELMREAIRDHQRSSDERRLDGRAPLHDLDEGLLLRTSLRMWRAMEPELDWKRSGMVPRMRRPPKMRLNAPTPMPFRRYTRRAMAAARM